MRYCLNGIVELKIFVFGFYIRRTVPEGYGIKVAPERFQVVEDWLTARRQLWEARLDRFDQYVKQLKQKESES